MIKKILIINGTQRTLIVEGQESLAEVLRDRLLLTGCKIGCGEGHCGSHPLRKAGRQAPGEIPAGIPCGDHRQIKDRRILQDCCTG